MGSVKRMVDKFIEGYNVTIMAYGQTSSGKTYTMGTAAPTAEDRGSPSEGIIPRAVAQLFSDARRPPPIYPGYKIPPLKTIFRVSFVEIYNEDLIDLLIKGDFRPPVTIREDARGKIYWTGVQEIEVSSVEEVIQQTHSTEMNEKSSRSHAIFSITLRQEKFVPTHPPPPQPSTSAADPHCASSLSKRAHSKSPSISNISGITAIPSSAASARPGTPTTTGPSSIPAPFTSGIVAPGSKLKRQSAMVDTTSASQSSSTWAPTTPANDDPEPEGEWVTLNSKFHFVDLAGSERLKRTSAIGDRAKEGISINAGLHALGNVISALGDPSKRASHVPYRDSKLTRLLQDSLGGNAHALMIACVSPSEINLGETLNTLKYANRARNIKNSSSLNQELNMDNPEYLRSIIQKLKLEIKLLKEASLAKAETGASGDVNGNVASDSASPRSLHSNRHSIASASTVVPGGLDDASSEDRAMSPSPSRRLSHRQSRESISTDMSHSYLDAVQEEDDRYSDVSSSTRAAFMGIGSSNASGITAVSPTSRINIAPLVIPPSLDAKSFQDFVEPVIEEYEKVISGLESHLAMTQAALNHSELMLEEQQGRIEVVEDENRLLLKKQQPRSNSGSESEETVASRKQHQALEQQLQTVQEQLKEAEARKAQRDQYIQELEEKLAKEQVAAQEQTQRILKDKEEVALRSRSNSPHLQSRDAKEQELKLLSERIAQLEEQVRRQQEEAEAEAETLRQEQASTAALESDREREEREAIESKREEELIEKLQTKAALELEIESEKARQQILLAEMEAARTSHVRADSDHASPDDANIDELAISPALPTEDNAKSAAVKALEAQLAEARESERILKDETVALHEKLEKLQKDHASVLEMEEMLQLAVSDLEGRLKSSQESDSKRLEELEQNLARIQDLEERSTKAEQEALRLAEELKDKLAQAKTVAEERLADELLELLEKMETERSKVEALQTQVENHLAELATEKARAAELESDRDAIQVQWDADKERIHTLEKEIEEHALQVREKSELIASLKEQVSLHEGTLAAKQKLELQLEQRIQEHDSTLASKAALILELEQTIKGLELSMTGSDENTKELVAKVQAELSSALEQLSESEAKAQDQEQVVQELRDKITALDAEAISARDGSLGKEAAHTEAIQALESKVKLAEAGRDDAETRLEEAERRHQAVAEDIKTLQADVAQHLATIELLQTKLSEAQSSLSSRPVSVSSCTTNLVAGEEHLAIQKLEKEKAWYRAIVRENEKEIERLSQDLESLASAFSEAATASEDAEDELKVKIRELESLLEEKNVNMAGHLSTTSLTSSNALNPSTRELESSLDSSLAVASKAQLTSLKAERDQALQSSEKLSSIVAELNEKNHSLQERLLNLEREQESIKLQHVLESQAQLDEIRMLRDRAERLDRNATPSPVSHSHDEADSQRHAHERALRHKSSSSSDQFGNSRGEDSLATPRQSWSTTASASASGQQPLGSQVRNGRHESTLIQQAKHIKLLEERIAELQANSGGGGGSGAGSSPSAPLLSSTSAIGLGILHKGSDPELARSMTSPMIRRQSSERMSPSMRSLATFGGPSAAAPPTPPPQVPLPPPPASSAPGAKMTAAHLSGTAPPSPRVGGAFNLEASSPHASPNMRPSRTGSVGHRASSSSSVPPSPGPAVRRERDSTSSNVSESMSNSGAGGSNTNGWMSPTGSTLGVSSISAATAQALQGVEVNELRGVVDTLAHQVQALKVEQTMQLGKVHRLEAALADAEERLKVALSEKKSTAAEKEVLSKELEGVREELLAAKAKSEKDRAGLESIVEKERREREKAVETRAIMEARMEELMGRKSKFACF
ncbi:hypothetical protein EDD11_006905 [Mortierella claussenii]|nr:hypothetical protein EDD11_006905 [Mortierella claussenii]